jgi:hypothetical protein
MGCRRGRCAARKAGRSAPTRRPTRNAGTPRVAGGARNAPPRAPGSGDDETQPPRPDVDTTGTGHADPLDGSSRGHRAPRWPGRELSRSHPQRPAWPAPRRPRPRATADTTTRNWSQIRSVSCQASQGLGEVNAASALHAASQRSRGSSEAGQEPATERSCVDSETNWVSPPSCSVLPSSHARTDPVSRP